MINQYPLIYVIGESEKENKVHKAYIQSSLSNAAIDTYNNSWIAYNALRADCTAGRQPNMIFIDNHMLHKNGFHFIEEYSRSPFFNKEKTQIYIISTNEDKTSINYPNLNIGIKIVSTPLTAKNIGLTTAM